MRFEIRPLAPEKGPTLPVARRDARFRAGYDDTLNVLGYETEHLGAKLVILQVDVPDGLIRRDGLLYARAVADSPAVRVSFASRHGDLTYADRYLRWQDNLRAVALSLEALRAVDRYGVSRSGEQYRGWTAITAAPHAMTRAEAAEFICRWAGLGTPTIMLAGNGLAAAYRAAAKRLHPDAGGDPDLMAQLTAARDLLAAGARP